MATTEIDTRRPIPTTRRRRTTTPRGGGGECRAIFPQRHEEKRQPRRGPSSSWRRQRQVTRSAAPPQRLASNCLRRHIDAVLAGLTVLLVAMVVISQNVVDAAQRDAYRHKEPKGVGNANAIQGAGVSGTVTLNGHGYGSYVGVGAGDGNGNAAGGGNTNTISNGNTLSSSLKGTAGSRAGGVNATGAATTTATAAAAATTVAAATTTWGGGAAQRGGSTSGANRNSNEVLEDQRSGPYFDKGASKNVTALLGKTAYLNCRVKNLGNKTMLLQVSWVRHRDIHLLTVGRYTYTSDQRFRAIHQPQTEDWILQIKYPQHRDSGVYECQVSTTPHMSHYIQLTVIEPSTEIVGAPDLYIENGSTINLTCVILNSPEPPAYIFWNHNEAIINYDSPRGGVSVVTNKGEITTSFLLIKSAKPSDSGQYQCNPSNAKSKSVTVHVLNGEIPAAMQRAGQAHHRMSQSLYLLVYLSVYLFTLASVKQFMRYPVAPEPAPAHAPPLVAGGAAAAAF